MVNQTGNVDTSRGGVDVNTVIPQPNEEELPQEEPQGPEPGPEPGEEEPQPQEPVPGEPAPGEEPVPGEPVPGEEPTPPEEPAPGGESAYDPSAHSVSEVLEFIQNNPEQREAVLAAEEAGKNRKGITEA